MHEQKRTSNLSGPIASANVELLKTTELFDALKGLEQQGATKALLKAQKGISHLLINTDRALLDKLAVVYAAARVLRQVDDEWNEFAALPDWRNHPKVKPKRENPLHAAIRLAVGFNGPRSNSTVHRYYKALQPLFDEDVNPLDVPGRILAGGGVENMRQSSTLTKSKETPQPKLRVSNAEKVIEKLREITVKTEYKATIVVEPISGGLLKAQITKLKARG